MRNNKKDIVKVAPGEFIGVIGGGQLGRMIVMAAARLGIKSVVFSETKDCPAQPVADEFIHGSYQDAALLDEFSRKCKVITYEFENIPLSVIDYLASRTHLNPGRDILSVTQDRLSEKTFLNAIGIPVSDFSAVAHEGDIKFRLEKTNGAQAIMKTRRFGYDGKGQTRVGGDIDPVMAYYDIKEAPAIIEDIIPFQSEFSVIGVRTLDGQFHHYDIADNEHVDGILHKSIIPSVMPEEIQSKAVGYTKKIADSLNYVGVIVVEYFYTHDGQILANEIAPRVHNSGHWTIDGCVFNQFDQHLRAICGWPMGHFERHSDAEMTNLIGDDIADWENIVADHNTALHIYGKSESRPGRKMGHATRLSAKS